jgi:hypothetical protein
MFEEIKQLTFGATMRAIEQTRPQARIEGLVIQEVADEVLVYDLDRDKAHCLNQTAAIIWKHCTGENSISDLAHLLAAEAGLPANEEMVWLALDQLGRAKLLPERLPLPSGQPKMSRREVMRKVGLASIIALPLVTSILAPTAAQAGSACQAQACTPGGGGDAFCAGLGCGPCVANKCT